MKNFKQVAANKVLVREYTETRSKGFKVDSWCSCEVDKGDYNNTV